MGGNHAFFPLCSRYQVICTTCSVALKFAFSAVFISESTGSPNFSPFLAVLSKKKPSREQTLFSFSRRFFFHSRSQQVFSFRFLKVLSSPNLLYMVNLGSFLTQAFAFGIQLLFRLFNQFKFHNYNQFFIYPLIVKI